MPDQTQVEEFLDWLIVEGDPLSTPPQRGLPRTRLTIEQIVDKAREVRGVPKPCREMEGMTGIRCFLPTAHGGRHEGWIGESYEVAIAWPVLECPTRVIPTLTPTEAAQGDC